MTGDAPIDPDLGALLASLEINLAHLAQARDPETVDLAHEMQGILDNIRAEVRQLPERTARAIFTHNRKIG